MNIEGLWEKAQEKTEVIRGRVKALQTFSSTKVPYVFLAESAVNEGHIVVRKGKIIVEKPLIFLPENLPQFEGFDFEEALDIDRGVIQTFFFMRGIKFPSLKYNNTVDTLDVEDISITKGIKKYKGILEKQENVHTALILGPEDCWQFSILIYIASLVGRCVRADIMNIMDRFREEYK